MGYEPFKNVEGFTPEVYESMPDLNIFGVMDLSVSPSECMNTAALTTVSGWLILSIPVLTFLAYFFSMRMTRKFTYQPMNDAQQAQTGCSNKVMDIVMPLLSVFISFGVPAALGVYWIFKSILGVAQRAALSYAMPLPKFTEEDYKAAEREIGARVEKSSAPKKSGKAVRSLHHIDDEDFEDTAEKARKHREALEAQEAENAQKKAPAKKSGLVDAAPIKTDDRKEEKSEEAQSKDEE
jgi:membrane protein insertase Oxa1/YidC/SpoIIIJ